MTTRITVSGEALAPGTYTLNPDQNPGNPQPPGGGGQPSNPDAIMVQAGVTNWVPWDKAVSYETGPNGFPCEHKLVFGFEVPVGATGSRRMAVSQHSGGAPTTRQIVLSLTPGTFDAPLKLSEGNTATIYFGVGDGMVAGETYYVNIRNYSRDLKGLSCKPGTQCPAIINYQLG
jgi:hypothetical protein